MPCLRIDRRKQGELFALLCECGLVHQHDRRQVGGRPPTSLRQLLAELPDPLPDRHMRSLNARPATHPLDRAKTYPMIVQQGRQLDRLATVRSRSKNSISSGICQLGKFSCTNSTKSRTFPSLSLS